MKMSRIAVTPFLFAAVLGVTACGSLYTSVTQNTLPG